MTTKTITCAPCCPVGCSNKSICPNPGMTTKLTETNPNCTLITSCPERIFNTGCRFRLIMEFNGPADALCLYPGPIETIMQCGENLTEHYARLVGGQAFSHVIDGTKTLIVIIPDIYVTGANPDFPGGQPAPDCRFGFAYQPIVYTHINPPGEDPFVSPPCSRASIFNESRLNIVNCDAVTGIVIMQSNWTNSVTVLSGPSFCCPNDCFNCAAVSMRITLYIEPQP